MTDTLEVSVNGLDAVLHAQGAVFIPSRRCLLVADIHLGKASFFAANGIGLPSGDTDHDLKRLTQLCERFGCNRIVSLGDLAHSAPRPGERWPEQLAAMLAARPLLRIDSVVGNHDRNVVSKVRVPGLRWHREVDLDGALCVHDRDCESVDRERRPVFSGHLHPGIVLPGRSRLRLPVFWHHRDGMTLPAFGSFTGLEIVRPAAGERAYAINRQSVVQVVGKTA